MRKSRILYLAAGTAAMSLVQQFSKAASYTWSNLSGGTQSWTDVSNWGGSGSPTGAVNNGDGANVSGNFSSNLSVTIPTGNYYVNSLTLGSTTTPRVIDIGNANAGGGTITFDNGVPGSAGQYATITSGGVAGSTNIISAPVLLDQNGFYSGVLNSDVNSTATSYGTYTIHTQGTLNSVTFFRNVDTGIQASLVIDPSSTNDLTMNGAISQVAGVSSWLTNAMSSARTLTINGAINLTAAGNTAAQTFSVTGINGSKTVINGVIGDGAIASTLHSTFQIGNTNPSKTTVYPAISPTVVLNGTNTYTGLTTWNMASIVAGSNQPFGVPGTTPVSSLGEVRIAGSANEFGYNLMSDDDARTIPNGLRLGQFMAIEGTHSLTWSGYMYQTSNRGIINLLPTNKTFTVSGSTYTSGSTGDGARTWELDGSGTTVISGPIYNNGTAASEASGVDGPLTKQGTGILLVSNTGNTYRGVTTVSGGLLQFASPGSYGVQSAGFVPTGVFNPVTGGVGTVPPYSGTLNGTTSIVVNTGATVSVATGTATTDVINRINAAATNSTGALGLATADAAVNLDFTGTAGGGALDLSNAHAVGMSIGAGNTPVSYTGTITPASSTYRLGGGGTLTLPNAQLSGAGNSVVISNGGTVALNGANTYGGTTTVQGTYVVSDANRAANNDFSAAAGAYEPQTLSVSQLAPGGSASSIGSSPAAAANLVLNGGTLKYTGAGSATDRSFTIGPNGATLDASGSSTVSFTATGAVAQTNAPVMLATTLGRAASSGAPFNQVALASTADFNQIALGMTATDSAGALTPYGTVTVTGVDSTRKLWLSFQPVSGFVPPSNDKITFTTQNRALTLSGSNTGNNLLAAQLTDGPTTTLDPLASTTVGGITAALAVNKTGSGTWLITGDNTYTGNTTVSAGKLVIGNNGGAGVQTRSVNNLVVQAGATAGIANGGTHAARTLLTLNNLSLSGTASVPTSTLDIADNSVILPTGNYANLFLQVKSGFNFSNSAAIWQGQGITSSTAATDSTHTTGVGLVVNNDGAGNPLYGGAGTPFGAFEGQSPALNSVLIKYTYYGDANLNGKVDGTDYSLVDGGFNNHKTGWINGDFNYDGIVDGSDYSFIDGGFNNQGAQLGNAASPVASVAAEVATTSTAVPEPGTLSLLGIGTAALLGRRRRKA